MEMYDVLFRDCVIGSATTKEAAIALAREYADWHNWQFDAEIRKYGRTTLRFYSKSWPRNDIECISIVKE